MNGDSFSFTDTNEKGLEIDYKNLKNVCGITFECDECIARELSTKSQSRSKFHYFAM